MVTRKIGKGKISNDSSNQKCSASFGDYRLLWGFSQGQEKEQGNS